MRPRAKSGLQPMPVPRRPPYRKSGPIEGGCAMLVRDRMTSPVVTVGPKSSIHDALAVMKEKGIRRLPVVKGQTLVGIVTWTDLMRASPSPATSLSVSEISYLLMKAPVSEVMTKNVITTSPGATIEEVAVQMRQHKIGGLPVVEDGVVGGIVTESDIFDAFIDLMGLNRGGTRLTGGSSDPGGARDVGAPPGGEAPLGAPVGADPAGSGDAVPGRSDGPAAGRRGGAGPGGRRRHRSAGTAARSRGTGGAG